MLMLTPGGRATSVGVGVATLLLAPVFIESARQTSNSSDQTVFRAGVDVVELDVSVLDRARKPVRGLSASDFTVSEDGRQRPIVAFSAVDLSGPNYRAGGDSWVAQVAPDVVTNVLPDEGRLVVIAFDWSIRFEDQAAARRIGRAAIEQLGSADLASVVFTSQFANGGEPQNFTSDRGRLLAAVDRPFAPALTTTSQASGQALLVDPSGRNSADCYCRVCVPDTISRIADTVKTVSRRRKVMLFVGTHFQAYEGGVLGGLGSQPGGAFPCAAPLRQARERMVRATGLANLTIHVLDPMGLTVGNQSGRQQHLALLADYTGGRMVTDTNAPEGHVPAVFDESRSYYLLGFTPADLKAGRGLRKIEVNVARPDVSVRTRAWYAAEDPRLPSRSTARPPLTVAIEGVLPSRGLALSIAAASFATPGNPQATVAIVTGVQHPGGTQDPDRVSTGRSAPGSEQVTMITTALDPKARPVVSRRQVLPLKSAPGSVGDPSFEILSRLVLRPGRYEIRVAVENAAGLSGSVYTYVDVTDFAKDSLSMSGIVLQATPARLSAPANLFGDMLPIVPTTQRELRATDGASAFVRVYQGGKNVPVPIQVSTRLLDESGLTLVYERSTLMADRFSTNRSADIHVTLPTSRLAPGQYLLTVAASRETQTARRDLRFTVR